MRNHEEIDRYLERMIRTTERDIDRVFAKRMQTINRQLETIVDMVESGRVPSRTQRALFQRFSREFETISEGLTEDYRYILTQTQALLEDTYIQNYMQRLYYGEYMAQTAVLVTAPAMQVITEAVENPIDKLKLPRLMEKHRRAIIQQVRDDIAEGLLAGKGYADIAAQLEKSVGFSGTKAKRVARTEAGRVQTGSTLKVFDQMQEETTLDWVKTWSSTLDQRVRPAHRVLDGQNADDEGYFHYQGYRATGPHRFNVPWLDINCRCSVHMLPAGYEMEERRAVEDGESVIRSNVSYRQWFEERTGQSFKEWYKETTGRELKD